MFRKHVIQDLSSYHHGELRGDEKLRVESHLRACARCEAALEEIRFGARLASTLTTSDAPESIWQNVQAAAPGASPKRPEGSLAFVPALAVVLVVAMAVVAGLFFQDFTQNDASWEVAVRGVARVGGLRLAQTGRLRAGQALQTGASSEAEVKIANIGQLTIDPNTTIRLLVTKSDEHRIALERGRVEARTWAPPRLFVVDTPSATAIDLGCKYTLDVEDDGSSLLHVTLGLVALEREGRETVVPAGAFCRTRQGRGPGTPYFDGASIPFLNALDDLDSGVNGPRRAQAIQILLRESRIRDGLSLWYLIPRLDPQSRGLIYDRLSELIPPPAGVTREGITALDPNMIAAWHAVVAQLWQ